MILGLKPNETYRLSDLAKGEVPDFKVPEWTLYRWAREGKLPTTTGTAGAVASGQDLLRVVAVHANHLIDEWRINTALELLTEDIRQTWYNIETLVVNTCSSFDASGPAVIRARFAAFKWFVGMLENPLYGAQAHIAFGEDTSAASERIEHILSEAALLREMGREVIDDTRPTPKEKFPTKAELIEALAD